MSGSNIITRINLRHNIVDEYMQIILIIGTKLQVIITQMGRRTHEMADVVKGTPMVQPGDDLFWFGRPKLVLLLINFVLFQVNIYT